MQTMVLEEFNGNIAVTELLMKTLEGVTRDLACRCIVECSKMYNFDIEEAIRRLGLENLSLIRKQMAKREASAKRESNVKREPKKRETKEKKSSFPMPFAATCVIENGCQGLAYNRGLFTQCQKSRMENGTFCSGCQGESDKNASGCPDCGTVEQRVATGLYEFKDSKGRSPISYLKVLAKLKLSVEQAIEEAGKMNFEIDEEHFLEKVKGKAGTSSRGRPKRPSAQVESNNVEDLFAGLTAESEELGEEIEEKPSKGSKKSKLTEEEKETKRLELEAERAAKKLEREAKLAEEKLEREAKRAAEAEQRKQEREAKLALEKAEREAARLKEKEERDAKKAAEKGAQGSKKSSKSSKSETKSENVAPTGTPVVTPVAPATPAPAAPAPAKVTVTRIQIGGKQYLKSSANILYDPATKEELGLYDPETKTIKPLPEDDEEEEEEDYDEEEA